MLVRRWFAPEPGSIAEAREFVSAALTDGSDPLGSDVVASAVLAVSELSTNAVRHAGTRFEVSVELGGPLRITVRDDRPGLDIDLCELDVDAEAGRGLQLVHATADSWGSYADPLAKHVWWQVDDPFDGGGRARGSS